MMISTRKLIGMGLLAACLQTGAMAQVIPWQLTGSFDDGATLIGRFDYNPAGGGTFSNISINTGPGNFQFATELLGWHFDDSTVVFTANGLQFHDVSPGTLGGGLEDYHDLYFFGFDPAQPVSSAITFSESAILGCCDPLHLPGGFLQSRTGFEDGGFAQVIPEPETYALMLAGLGFLGF